MRTCSFLKVLAAGLFLFLFSALAYGQLGKGVITGTVSDPTGAFVPGAEVTLINQSTLVKRAISSNSSGTFRFDFTDVGSYTLRVSAQNFSLYEMTDMVLNVGQTLTTDVQLELAKGQTQTITVEAKGSQLIQTSNTEVSGLIDRNSLASLPLEIRDPSAFVNLLPGAVPSAIGNQEFNGSTRGSSVNGARGGTGNFIIEGFDNNDQGQGGRGHNTSGSIPGAIVGISPDAIQEFQVVTNNFSAQYGRQSGFVADAVLKSGSNRLHGSAFEYNRNQAITANDFFTNRAQSKDSLVRNQFGGSLGGPIHKDKTFMFGALEIQRLRQGSPLVLTSLTPDFVNFVKTGAFASFNETSAKGFCMVNLGAPCPGAFATANTVGPIATQLLQTFPAPVPTGNFQNVSSGDAVAGIQYPVNLFGDATVTDHFLLNETRFSTKFDHSFNSTNLLSVVMALDNFPTLDSAGGTDATGNVPTAALSRSQNWGLTYTHFFSPTVLNEAKVSYLRNRAYFPRNIAPSAPSVVTFDALTVGFGMSSNLPQKFIDTQFQYQDHVAITHGAHNLKLGGEYRRTRNASVFAAVRDGLFEFWDTENFLTDGKLADITDGLLGISDGAIAIAEASVNPQTGQKPEYYRGFRGNEIGWYIQDDWKVRPRVSINLGLRYDYFGPPHNFRPGFDSNFFFGPATTPIATKSNNPFFPLNSVPYAREATATFQLRDHEIWKKDLNNFAPRFGVAWDVFGNHKTVLRTGGGVFYDRFWNNLFENIRFNPPLFSFNSVGALANGLPVSPANTPGLYASTISTPAFNNPAFQPKPSPRHMAENMRTPYTEQIFFGLQRELPGSAVLEVNYIGTFAHKLTGVIDLNTFPGRLVRNGFSTRRPNNSIGSDNARGNYFNSNYHSLQVSVQKQMSHGLQFRTQYTYAKALDYVSDAFNNRATGGNVGVMDVINRQLDYGRADFDLRHRFVGTINYDLPVFRGNAWLGGWSVNSIVTLQTGLPFNIYNSSSRADYNKDGKLTDRPDYVGGGSITSIINHSKGPADGYISNVDASGKALFAAPMLDPSINMGLWRDGRLGRNILSGPGLVSTDFSLAKKFRIQERASVQLQFNFFNIFNRSNFALPDGNLNNSGAGGTFGRSTASFGPRIGQIAARIDF